MLNKQLNKWRLEWKNSFRNENKTVFKWFVCLHPFIDKILKRLEHIRDSRFRLNFLSKNTIFIISINVYHDIRMCEYFGHHSTVFCLRTTKYYDVVMCIEHVWPQKRKKNWKELNITCFDRLWNANSRWLEVYLMLIVESFSKFLSAKFSFAKN